MIGVKAPIQRLFKRLHEKHVVITSSAVISQTLQLQLRYSHNGISPINPVKLAYSTHDLTQSSNKEPIVIMHGLLGSKNNWNSIAKTVNQKTDRKVITVDARNHGDSPHSPEMSYKHMAQDVAQLLDDSKHEKAILVGHSMGGSTMMYLALSRPKLVEKLIVVDMSPVRISPSLTQLKDIFQAMLEVKFDNSLPMGEMRRSADAQLARSFKSTILRQFLLMNLAQTETGTYKWRANLPVLHKHFVSEIAKFPNVGSKVFKGPTFFIGGGNSDYIPHSDHDAIRNLFPMAIFTYIEDANHWVHFEKPHEFLRFEGLDGLELEQVECNKAVKIYILRKGIPRFTKDLNAPLECT